MPSSQHLRIIVTGQMAQYPMGGNTWFYLQYVLGLAALGHDVYYMEDTGQWPYDPSTESLPAKGLSAAEACRPNLLYLNDALARFGLSGKWAYCFPWEDVWFGMSGEERSRVLSSADLLLNVSGTLRRPEYFRPVRRLAYIDTDPVFTHVKLSRGQTDFQALVDTHDVTFSFGEHPSQAVPDTGHNWLPTRAPVVLSEWRTGQPYRNVFTTVMNWTSHNSVSYQGRTYGQKNVEFRKFIDLPKAVAPTKLELAIAPGHGERTPYDLLRHKGWQLADPNVVCPDVESLRTYTESSMGEWSIAKNGYVEGQSGWFSERSARYLAAGRPVIVQDTGFTRVFPTGEGLLPFTNQEQSVEAIRAVEGDYARHAKAARAIAEEYFDSAKVLTSLVERAMEAQ